MASSVALALFVAAAAVGTLQACTEGPGREDVAIQRLQTLLCEKAQACGCGPLDYDVNGEPLACGEWSPASGGGDYASRAFDPGCVERWVTLVEDLSCGAAAIPSYAQLCPLYHGTLRAGEPCDDGYSLTETACGRGLLCVASTCRDPLRTRFGDRHEPCDLAERCNDGLVCADQVCGRLPSAGEPCLDGYRCNDESYCDTGVCIALPGPGQRCDGGQCRPGSFCLGANGGQPECRVAGDVGAPCQGHGECISGNCPAGVCEAPAGDGDPCGSQLPCGPGLVCNEGTCRGSATGAAVIPTCELVGVL